MYIKLWFMFRSHNHLQPNLPKPCILTARAHGNTSLERTSEVAPNQESGPPALKTTHDLNDPWQIVFCLLWKACIPFSSVESFLISASKKWSCFFSCMLSYDPWRYSHGISYQPRCKMHSRQMQCVLFGFKISLTSTLRLQLWRQKSARSD